MLFLAETAAATGARSPASELYRKAKEYVAPVIAGFAHYLLTVAKDRKIVFAARDGIGAYQAAEILKQRFDYDNDDPEQLKYAYLTRKVIFGSGNLAVKEHLEQLGIDTNDRVTLADIGMFGSFVPEIRKILPEVDVQYLISHNPNIAGYAHNPQNPAMESMRSVIGNTAVHFLEDTFSGPIKSPTALIEQSGVLVPNTINQGYDQDVALKRAAALAAIVDYANELQQPPALPDNAAIERLDSFLMDPANYLTLMAPHER